VEYHYGFATWAVFWLVGLALGVILQRKTKKNRS
jgi:choline-glycine betaine transporter